MTSAIAFVWENFGPTHADRCEAVAEAFAGRRRVVGIELAGQSNTYPWVPEGRLAFEKVTLFPDVTIDTVGFVQRTWRTVRACLSASDIFFCHYEHLATFVAAIVLRLLGRRVFVMSDSKFDDYARAMWREFGKSLLYLPYRGGIAAGTRSCAYMQWLGIKPERIQEGYDNISIARIRRLAKAEPAPAGAPFAARHFTVVARFIPKKNLLVALEAYNLYRRSELRPRPLCLIGSGPMERELRARTAELGLSDFVRFEGFLQTEQVCERLAHTLVLLLPSVEEQFGIAALEAIAMGVPVIVSDNCGVRDLCVRSGVNGFVVEADNAQGMANVMQLLGGDEGLWRRMASACAPFAEAGDASRFADAVAALAETRRRRRA